ncbi:hypothetical protein GQ457_08G024530 [Hibiscus cannabinus]
MTPKVIFRIYASRKPKRQQGHQFIYGYNVDYLDENIIEKEEEKEKGKVILFTDIADGGKKSESKKITEDTEDKLVNTNIVVLEAQTTANESHMPEWKQETNWLQADLNPKMMADAKQLLERALGKSLDITFEHSQGLLGSIPLIQTIEDEPLQESLLTILTEVEVLDRLSMTMDKKSELIVIDDTKLLSELTRKINEEPDDSAKDLRVVSQDKVPISEWCDDQKKALSTIQNVMPGICVELILRIQEGKSSGVNPLLRQKQELRLMANDETHLFDEMSARVMVARSCSDLLVNLPSIKKLDAMFISILDGFHDLEFYYADRGVVINKTDGIEAFHLSSPFESSLSD